MVRFDTKKVQWIMKAKATVSLARCVAGCSLEQQETKESINSPIPRAHNTKIKTRPVYEKMS